MEYKDFYMSVNDYCELLKKCIKESNGDNLDTMWHPEDLYHQIKDSSEAIFTTLNYIADRSYNKNLAKMSSRTEEFSDN